MSTLRFSELIDIRLVQDLVEAHYQTNGMPTSILDAETQQPWITTGGPDARVCVHQGQMAAKAYCNDVHRQMLRCFSKGQPIQARCAFGLWYVGIPIVLSEQPVAIIFLAPFHLEYDPPMPEMLQSKAHEFGLDLEAFLQAFERAPKFSQERVDSIVAYYAAMARFLSALAEQTLEKQQTHLVMQQSEERYRILFEHNQAAMACVEDNSVISMVNSGFEALSGYTREELIGKKQWMEFVASEADIRRMLEYHRTRRQTAASAPGTYEFSFKPRTGQVKKVVISISLIPGTKQSLATFIDITHRKEAEENLKMANKQLADIIDFLPDATFIIDRNKKIIAWNRAMEIMTEVPKAEILGKDHAFSAVPFYGEPREFLMDLLQKDDNELIAKYSFVERRGNVLYAEAYTPELYHKRGATIWVTASPLLDAEGNLIGAIESIRDISAWKQSERALHAAKQHLQAIYDASPDMIFIHAADGRILDVNENVIRTYGYTRDEWREMPISKTSGDGYTAEMANEKFQATLRGETTDFEWMAKRKNGEAFPIEVRLRRLDAHSLTGKSEPWILALVRDLTERKRAEDMRKQLELQLQHAQKMESVGLLAGGIAHDFNNLLTPVLGYAELLLETLATGDEHYRPVQSILHAAERARDLTRQLLAFSRKQLLELKPVQLESVAKSFEPMLRRTLRENIEIRVIAAPVLPCVYADPGQVEQVLMNLAINAQDAMPLGGVLSIQVNAVHLASGLGSGEAVLAPGSYVVLTVGDTGMGMSQAVLDRLFEPFFTTKEQGRGTGLGLSTVYGIVRQHGGIILVESNQGQGSSFKIYFPVWDQPHAGGTGHDESSGLTPAHGTETILIMEDDPMVRKVAGEMLQQLGYTAVLAENPEDCLTLLAREKQPIHLLLTDVVMPTMDGRELARRAQAALPKLKVLYMSGYTHEVIDHAGVLEPGIQYIQKPLSLKMLSEKIRAALDTPQSTC